MHGCPQQYASKKVILSTGYYDVPNMLGVPGEDLPKVHSLLQGAASVLQSRRAGGGREEFGGDRGAGTALERRARHAWSIAAKGSLTT